MEVDRCAVLVLLLIAGTSLGPGGGAAGGAIAPFTLNIPGEAPASQGGLPLLVAGVWHDLRVAVAGEAWSVVLARPGAPDRDEGSYYRWEFSGGWRDVLYDHYVDGPNSTLDPGGFTLRLGVDAGAVPGIWHLEVANSGGTVLAADIAVAEARVSASWSGDDFTLRVDPYVPATVDARATGQRFRLYNEGNVPLEVAVAFDHYGDRLRLTGLGPILGVGAEAVGSLVLDAPSWSPRAIHLGARLVAEAAFVVPPRAGSRVLPRFEIPFGVHILVAHEGMALAVLGPVAYQWPRTARVAADGRADLLLYFDGAEDVEVTVAGVGAKVVDLEVAGVPARNPALLSLAPGAETPLRVRLLLTDPRGGRVDFTIRSLATLDRATFNTSLEAGEVAPNPETGGPTALPLGGAALAAVAAGALLYAGRARWRRRGRGPRRRAPPRRRGGKRGARGRAPQGWRR